MWCVVCGVQEDSINVSVNDCINCDMRYVVCMNESGRVHCLFLWCFKILFKTTFDLLKMDLKYNLSTHNICRGDLNETFPNVNVKVILKFQNLNKTYLNYMMSKYN